MIDWVMKSEGVSFRHAVELLRERGGAIEPGEPIEPMKKTSVPEARLADRHTTPTIARRCARSSSYYHETLKAIAGSARVSAQARHRRSRKRSSASSSVMRIARSGCGCRRRTARQATSSAVASDEARHPARIGSRALQRLAGDPDRSTGGEVVGMYGRKILDNLRPGTPLSPLSAGAASRRVEPRSAGRVEGDHPLRGADRRADVLVRGASAT